MEDKVEASTTLNATILPLPDCINALHAVIAYRTCRMHVEADHCQSALGGQCVFVNFRCFYYVLTLTMWR